MPDYFGARLKALRKKAGLTQEELADVLGISYMTVRRWEAGKASPRVEDIPSIAQALGVPEADLLDTNASIPFGANLKALRRKAGLTQSQLADKIGVSLLTLFRWEKDERQPRMSEIKALAKALGVSEAELLHESPSNSGDWTIRINVADKFSQEVINLNGNIQPVAQITATPDGCAFTIKANWDLLQSKAGLEKLFKRILKESYPAMRGTGVALGGIKDKD